MKRERKKKAMYKDKEFNSLDFRVSKILIIIIIINDSPK